MQETNVIIIVNLNINESLHRQLDNTTAITKFLMQLTHQRFFSQHGQEKELN